MPDKLCPFMSRPIDYLNCALGRLLSVYCQKDCMARRRDGGCKLIDGKE
jgi:hypothetical protein